MSVPTRRMSHLDAALFALETPANHMNIGLLATFAPGGSSASQVVELLRERLSKSERYDDLRLVVRPSKIGYTPPKLVDGGDLDLGYHVQTAHLSGDGGDGELDGWVSHEMSFPLSHDKPLWQMFVVDGLKDGGFALFLKGHHGVMDGPAALNTALQIFDGERLLGSSHVTHGFLGDRRGRVTSAIGGVLDYVSYPVRIVRLVLDPTRSAVTRNRLSFWPKFFIAPRTAVNRSIGGDRTVVRASLPLDRIAKARRHADATSLDLVLAVVSSSLRKVLKMRDALPVQSLIAMVPVAQSGDMWRKSSGNRIALEFVSLATNIGDPHERLRRIVKAARDARQVTRLRGSDLWERYSGIVLPGPLHWLARFSERVRLFDRIRPFASVIVSSLSGPRTSVTLGGSQLTGLWPFGPPRDGGSLNVTAVSFGDRLYFGVVGDKALSAEVNEMARGFSDALDEISSEDSTAKMAPVRE